MPETQKRSSITRMSNAATNPDTRAGRPGGSAAAGRQPGTGGGYLDGCTTPEPPSGEDPRLAELRELGLGQRWLAVAERIGVDAFIDAWEVLDSHTDPDQLVRIPGIQIWNRYQRNRWIQLWARDGVPKSEIRRLVQREFCERLSCRHIDRIIAADTINA